jgi:glycosyltransferase involved in cell wall biosynthesis
MTTEQQLTLSVCMIAGAEAARIRRALDSVAGWADEIIVVIDDDVTDGTDQIASACGAKVFREPWKGYIAQKNSAAEKATRDWILGLDADEVVSPELRAEIQQLLARPDELRSYAAFGFPRCTWYCGRWIRHGDWYPDRKLRLWRRGLAHWGGISPHDTLIVNGRARHLRHDLLHYSMDDLNHHVRKIVHYSDLSARQRRESGRGAGAPALVFRPWWRFVRGYFLRLGFLDGWQGYVIARMVAFETLLRYAKVREAQARDVHPPRP